MSVYDLLREEVVLRKDSDPRLNPNVCFHGWLSSEVGAVCLHCGTTFVRIEYPGEPIIERRVYAPRRSDDHAREDRAPVARRRPA